MSLKKRNINADINACKLILRSLLSKKYKNLAWVFYDPIESDTLALYDYHTVVKEPMDLSTVKYRLNSNFYMTAGDFARDVRLIFSNAYLYTTPGHLCYEMAKQLEAVFEDLYAKVPLFNNVNESGIWSDASSDENVEGSCEGISSSDPSNFSYTTDVVNRSLVTTEEDLLLHNRVQQLDGVMLLNVIHMIHQMEGMNFGHGEIELEFDVRKLKATTKQAILSYIDRKDGKKKNC